MASSEQKDSPVTALPQLPPAAQEAYQKAYNKAWRVYSARGRQPNLEELVHSVALASLEAGYHKTERGRWVAD